MFEKFEKYTLYNGEIYKKENADKKCYDQVIASLDGTDIEFTEVQVKRI